MIRIFLCVAFLCALLSDTPAQNKAKPHVKPYWELALGAQLWTNSYHNIGTQLSAGILIKERMSLGVGVGYGVRNYDYFHFPIELGYEVWEGIGTIRVYYGTTVGFYSGTKGFLAGSEFFIKPSLDKKKLKLFLALGYAIENSAGRTYYDPVQRLSSTVIGPRFRVGFGI